MNPHFKPPFAALFFLCAILTGCEEPQQRTVAEEKDALVTAAPPTAPAPAPPTAPAPPLPAGEAPAPASVSDTGEPRPMEEPIFKIWMADKKITITGGLKSRIQVDRITTTMKGAFPEHEIVNELKVEGYRYPVAWGNRLADEFLVPYFKEVKSPGVAYQSGIVTLLGEVENSSRHRFLTEIAVDTFAGDLTQDIDNKITTRK